MPSRYPVQIDMPETRRQFLHYLSGGVSALGSPVSFAQKSDSAVPVLIDVGRQLFVDDYLIATTSLTRTFHQPRLWENNPVLRPETPLEMNHGMCPTACTFEDGVFYDPKDRLFKMWYMAGWYGATCLAVSEDGLYWKRPDLDIDPGTNRVLPKRGRYQRDGTAVWLDHNATNPNERFKMFGYYRNKTNIGFVYGDQYPVLSPNDSAGGEVYTSPDGIHWKFRANTGPCGDNTGMFYDPFRKVWVYSIRTMNARGRVRSYRSHPNFLEGANWTEKDMRFWATADDLDLPEPNLGYQTQLYKVGAVAYESLMVGLFAIHRGPPNEICAVGGFPKFVDLTVGYSRDGFHFERPDRRAFIAGSRVRGTWNRAYIHSAGGVCTIVGDRLHFYFGAWSGISPRLDGHMYAGGSTGVAILRRDGFASMDAGSTPGILTTRLVNFSGRHLFVNCNAANGELGAEVLDEKDSVIGPYSLAACEPVRVDKTSVAITWKTARDLAQLRSRAVKFRFRLANSQLYSFWVSPDPSGASHGYVAAGGPGFNGAVDLTGNTPG